MTTLYQLHSTMDKLECSVHDLARTWHDGDSILLLGSTVAFIDWLHAYLEDNDIKKSNVGAIYALAEDITQLSADALLKLNLDSKITMILSDEDWVKITQDSKFDKVVTIAL